MVILGLFSVGAIIIGDVTGTTITGSTAAGAVTTGGVTTGVEVGGNSGADAAELGELKMFLKKSMNPIFHPRAASKLTFGLIIK
jgi:hypothetical protein